MGYDLKKYLQYDISLEYSIISKSRNKVLNRDNIQSNFIHGQDHIINVERNIYKFIKDKKYNSEDILSLVLAAHWHDSARDDFTYESTPHEKSAIIFFTEWAKRSGLNERIIKKVVSIIESHRSSNSDITNELSSIFWDADKIDILNLERCKRIINNYLLKNSYKRVNRFNLFDSLCFWKNIDENFINTFKTERGKCIAAELLPFFKKYVNKVFEKYILKSKKLIGIGGGEQISGIFKEVDEVLYEKLELNKMLYIPIGVFNDKVAMSNFEEYLRLVKEYYLQIKPGIEFNYVNPEDSISEIVSKINVADVLYFAGGDTEYLVSCLSDKDLKDSIVNAYESGKCIIGNSAGILALFKKGYSCYEGKVKEYEGIGLVDDVIGVHFNNEKCIKEFIAEENVVLLSDNEIYFSFKQNSESPGSRECESG